VFETTLHNPPSEPEEQPAEGEVPLEWNSGANGYVYFAANSLGGPLTKLPHVTPGQIKAARRIKKLLTGRLTSQVSVGRMLWVAAHHIRWQLQSGITEERYKHPFSPPPTGLQLSSVPGQ